MMGIVDEKARCSNPECSKEIAWSEQYGHITHPVCLDCWLQGKGELPDDEQVSLTPYALKMAGKQRPCPVCQQNDSNKGKKCRWCNGTKKQEAFICTRCSGSGIAEHSCDCQFCEETTEGCRRCDRGIVWKAMERASANGLALAAA